MHGLSVFQKTGFVKVAGGIRACNDRRLTEMHRVGEKFEKKEEDKRHRARNVVSAKINFTEYATEGSTRGGYEVSSFYSAIEKSEKVVWKYVAKYCEIL